MRGVAELTAPSLIQRYDGRRNTPSKTTASQPARLSSAPQNPPDSDSPNPPVSGDLAPTLWRPGAGHRGAGDHAGGDDEDVVRAERVHAAART